MKLGQKILWFDWLAAWILFSATVSVSGWLLSAAGWLNRGGYLLAFALAAGFFLTKGRALLLVENVTASGCRAARFRRGLPLLWLALTVMIFIGGAWYSPSNFDYLTYRLPRVLSWLWEEHWFWISTVNQRMNYSGTGSEWLMAPLLAFTNSDRLFFLINFIPWLLLPGLFFSVFTKLSVSGRAARWWMWLLPSGYCFVTQAGSTGNDTYSAVYLLGALHYALAMSRARTRADAQRRLTFSCLAIALFTGVKLSNAPLALPWLVLLVVNWRQCRLVPRPLSFSVLLAVCALVSFVPITLLNLSHTGHYSGDPNNTYQMSLSNPVCGITGNALQIANANLTPPMCPVTVSVDKFLPAPLLEKIQSGYPRFGLTIPQLAIEESAAAGLGVTLALAAMCFVRARNSRQKIPRASLIWLITLLVALTVTLAKLGSESLPRILAPWYPPLVAAALLLIRPEGQRLGRTPFKILAALVMSSSALILILSPARPLFPATLAVNWLEQSGAPPLLVSRLRAVYTTYASRGDAFAELHQQVPPTERVLAVIQQGDDTIASFWRPFCSRCVMEVSVSDTTDTLSQQGVHYVAVNGLIVEPPQLAELQRQWHAELVWQGDILDKIQRGAVTWYLLKIQY